MTSPTVQKVKKISPIVPFNKLPSSMAWKLTSELVRKKSGGRCYTCNKVFPFNKLVAGHCREKRGNAAIYFDLDGLRAQCNYCNRRLHGNYTVYTLNLITEIGIKRVQALNKKARKSKQWTKHELAVIAVERARALSYFQEPMY